MIDTAPHWDRNLQTSRNLSTTNKNCWRRTVHIYITRSQMFVFSKLWSWKCLWVQNPYSGKFLFFHAYFSLCLLSFGDSNPAFIMQIFNTVLSRMLFRRIGNLKIKLCTKSTAYENRRRWKEKTKVLKRVLFINKIKKKNAGLWKNVCVASLSRFFFLCIIRDLSKITGAASCHGEFDVLLTKRK